MTDADRITQAYRQEVRRCTDVTLGRIKHVVATHTGGREAGAVVLANIRGAFSAHLEVLADAHDKALAALVEP